MATGRIVLILEYDGTRYYGSQFQPGLPTIQGEIEEALRKLSREKRRVNMAGRTDAGVHARGQVASFGIDSGLPLTAYVGGLNHYLPEDIAVRQAFRTDESFDVRRGALSREYRYSLLTSAVRSPLRNHFACRLAGTLDIAAMGQACRALLGRHDFASFVTAETGKSTVRSVHRAEVTAEEEMVFFDMVADSFLPHQVRNTVGSLVRVGQGKMTVDEFQDIVEAKTPGLAGPTAPACGLCLMRVNYPSPFEGDAR